MLTAETIIVSDIHLGSPISNAKLLNEVLHCWEFNRIIILGDLFACHNIKKLDSEDWQLLETIRSLVNQKEVIWVEGNHDIGPLSSLSTYLDVHVVQNYQWNWDNKKCYALHGHQFDNIVDSKISHILSWLYLMILEIPITRRILGERISKISTHIQNIVGPMRNSCFEIADKHGIDFIFAGHTHQYECKRKEDKTYINTGCWVYNRNTLVALGHEGDLKILSYSKDFLDGKIED